LAKAPSPVKVSPPLAPAATPAVSNPAPVAAAVPHAAPAAAARIGRITKVSGSVQFIRADSIRREKAEPDTEILEKYIILTGEQSAATLQLIDESTVVLDQNSRLEARDSNSFFQKSGIAYFDIKSRKTGASLKVGTEFAIIGVKGTQFIVNAATPEQGGVALRTGRLDIEAPTGEFAVHRRKITSEFEEFLQQQQGGFDDYKKQLQEDFIEYKKSFTLEPLKTISVQGAKVVERAFTQDELAEFARFEALR
jgi:ferric-dicitrate binding protein FerR (iron transport regulator)